MTFRKDINGLRAIAIISVVLFHFQITGFSGGFSGVDVFFVISGYLMTSIIFNRLKNNDFSIFEFYLHRARRIIPALAVLCFILSILGFLFVDYYEYKELSKYIRKTITFTSNIEYYHGNGYFDIFSKYNWLLHTWSLSIEWQFYIIYPIVLYILNLFFSEKPIKLFLILIAALSFAASCIYTPIDQMGAFYLLPTRMWQMLMGGIVFLLPFQASSKIQLSGLILGMSSIVLSIFLLNEEVNWPGYLSCIPVLGTALIIWVNYQNNIFLNNRVFQAIGKISYSVYLWHWPIVVFLMSSNLLTNQFIKLIGIALSFVLGMASYSLIECKFKLKHSKIIELIKYIIIIILIIALTKILVPFSKKYNIPDMFGVININKITENPANNHLYRDFFKSCLLTAKSNKDVVTKECVFGESKPSIIIMGDSHTIGIFNIINKLNDKGSTILWQFSGCPTVKNFTREHYKECISFNNEKLSLLDKKYEDVPVIIMNRYPLYLYKLPLGTIKNTDGNIPKNREEHILQYRNGFIDTVCEISKKRKVFLMNPLPELEYNVSRMIHFRSIYTKNLNDISFSLKDYYKENIAIFNMLEDAKKRCDIQILNPIPYLCQNENNCSIFIKGHSLYFDDNHLSEYRVSRLIPLFKKELNILASQND